MKTTTTFNKLVEAAAKHPRYIDDRGGTRSGKTYSALQLLALMANAEAEPAVYSVVSETLPHLKRGAVRDFQNIMTDLHWWDDKRWNKSDLIFTFPSGAIMEFFSADSPAKVHGPQRKKLLLNESQNIPWETARQLFTRTEGLIIYDYNPTAPFWGTDEIPKRAGCVSIHSTYKDNQYLSANQIAEIEANKKDRNYWRVYGLGEIGVLEGVVYDFQQIDELPDPSGFLETYGLDFGFTNDPTALVHELIHTGRRELYLDEVCYQRGMHNNDIAALLKGLGLRADSGPTVYADAAEPKSIDEIKEYGLRIEKAFKGGTIKGQIDHVKQYTIYVTKRSVNLIKEFRNYLWKTDSKLTDANGQPLRLNEPIDIWNHCMDAFRYGIYTPIFSNPYNGNYVVG